MPKILGTYELELHSILRNECSKRSLRVVDVGAGEGYYAIGILRNDPQAQVVAYEAVDHGRRIMSLLAAKNGVADRLEIRGECSIADLQQSLENWSQPMLIMDVEGAEKHLLDPTRAPALKKCTIIVEIHDDLEDLITTRFQSTHTITVIPSRDVSAEDIRSPFWNFVARLSTKLTQRLLQERPFKMNWFVMKPISGRNE